MTRAEFIAALRQSPIWEEDMYGHFKLEWKGIKYRLKIQAISVRYEKKSLQFDPWFLKASDYFKNVNIEDGRLKLQGRLIPIDKLPE